MAEMIMPPRAGSSSFRVPMVSGLWLGAIDDALAHLGAHELVLPVLESTTREVLPNG
jgi:hypothetical protein